MFAPSNVGGASQGLRHMSDEPENAKEYRGTRAHRPDLDWSQVRETVLMLELMSGQIMAAMRDSDKSVDVLATTFTGMAGYVNTIVDMVHQLPNTPDVAGQKAALSNIAEHVQSMVNQAVVAFQFYDRLVQRLSHVVTGHSEFSDIVGDSRQLYNPAAWVAMQNRIRASFSTREEHALLDAVLNGMPVEEAIESYLASLKQRDNEIELF